MATSWMRRSSPHVHWACEEPLCEFAVLFGDFEEEIFFEVKTSTAGTVKGKLNFIDGSRFEFAEFLVVRASQRRRESRWRFFYAGGQGFLDKIWDCEVFGYLCVCPKADFSAPLCLCLLVLGFQ
ncbi:MAG: hypothetical protein QXR19_17370 [Candidatus Jordarchaeaceae archaeon]